MIIYDIRMSNNLTWLKNNSGYLQLVEGISNDVTGSHIPMIQDFLNAIKICQN